MIPYLYWMLGIPKWTRIESIKVHLPYPCHVQKPPCHLVAVLMEDVVYHFHLNHLQYAILDRMMKRSKPFSMRSIESTECVIESSTLPKSFCTIINIPVPTRSMLFKITHLYYHPAIDYYYYYYSLA